MKTVLFRTIAGLFIVAFMIGCAATVYAPGPPPPPKAEVKPAAPGPKAIWVAGHWGWTGQKYAWVSGNWVKKPKGRWVPGQWQKRARGHILVAGHWRR